MTFLCGPQWMDRLAEHVRAVVNSSGLPCRYVMVGWPGERAVWMKERCRPDYIEGEVVTANASQEAWLKERNL